MILMEALDRGGAGFVLTRRNTSVLFATGLENDPGAPRSPARCCWWRRVRH